MALRFLKKFKEGVVDIFDANTQADQQRRLNSGQAQWYQDQQRQQGNMRPANNLFGQVAPSAGRLVNTARAGVGGLYGLGKVGAASVFGSDDDYRTTLTDVVNTMNKDLSPTGGFGGVGTFFDSPEQAAQSNPSMIGKKIVGGGLGVAGELAPIPALRAVKGGSTLIKGAKVAGMSGGANVVADVGSQLIEKGRVDPKRTAIAGATGALTGGALSFGGNAVNRAMPKNLRRNKLINEADELSEDITGNLGSSVDNITTKEPSYVRKRPSTIEEKRIQTRLGIDQPIGKKSTSLPQVKFKAAQRLAKENPPAYQRQGASALRQQAVRAVQQGNTDEATDIIRATQDLPSDITPKTRAVIESIRSKNAPPIEEGTPNTDTSLVKGEASKAPASMEDEFKAAASQNRSQAPKGNVGNYQYTKPQVTPKDRLGIKQTLSPDRLIRENITRPLVQKVQKGLFDASISENPVARGVSKLAQGVGKETALPQEILDARRQLFGQGELGKVVGADARALSKDFDQPSLERVYASLDPEQAAKLGITPDKLTPDEQLFRDKLVSLRDERTQGLAERGIITPEQAANENYLRRAYSVFEDAPEVKRAYEDSKKNLLNTLKSRKVEVSDDVLESAITDPGYLVGKNYAEYQQAIAVHDFVKNIADQGYVSDVARPGFTQLPKSKMFGENAGRFVPKTVADDIVGFQYTSGAMNALNDLLTAYDRLGIRKAKKAILTIFNPAVRVGNQLTNRVIFSQLNGINPITFNKNMLAARDMIKNRDPVYVEAVKQGLFSTDITKADFGTNILKYTDDSTAKKALQWFGKSYSGADDRAKLAAFKSHLDEGYSVEEAGRLTQRGFQDYNSVGFFYDLAAKTPLIGNAFVRFAGDANRIISNAFIDHPIRTIGTGVVWANLVNMMSKVSGETPEDKETREGRFGAPHIPFTDVSLTVQTPMGEINLARFVPMYALNDVGGGDVKRFLPFQGDPTKPQNFNDPLLGQFGQIATDTDFRGKSIADPLNTIFDRQTYNDTQGQAGAKFSRETNPEKVGGVDKDIAGFLATQNIPLGREANAIVSAIKGGPDVLGKERTLPQALQRAAGIKIEQFGPEQAEKQRNTNAFFEGNIKRTNDFLKTNPDLKSAYYKFNNPTRDRGTNTKVSDLVTPERWRILNSDKSGRLYEFLKSESLTQNKETGKPVDPVFQLNNPSRVKEVLELRSRPTGDDIEREEILRATTNWYKPFEKAERQYYESNSKFYESRPKSENPAKENPRVTEYRNVPHAEQSPLISQYYQAKAQGEQAGKDFFKANADKLSADFQAYKDARLKEINAKRAIEGYDPIKQDTFNNVTFGYEDDESKVAKELYYKLGGYGGRGGSGGPKSAGSAYKYAVDLNAGGEVAKPKVSVKGGSKTVSKKVSTKAPKVSIKKSKV